jgi:UDP:flavonoid glycosyltransferase YjiC (YdhE family)
MARLVVTTGGTLGDFVPFLTLAKALQSRGHDVMMAANPAMVARAAAAGIRVVPCGREFGPAEVRQRAALFDRPEPATENEIRERLRELELPRTARDLMAACRGADAVISSSIQGTTSWVEELINIPWISATIFAMEFPHKGILLPGESPYWPILVEARNEARAELGLGPVPADAWERRYWSKRLVLIASSRHFSQPILDAFPQARQTGFWCDPPSGDEAAIDPDLRAFLDAGAAPLVLSFSSQPVRDPATVVAVHAEAARRLGLRLVIQKGWAGFDRAMLGRELDSDAIHFAGQVPHDYLFNRSSAVIHHGGIGSTAQAMRQGRPALVEPHCNDQFFNAQRIHDLGVGSALFPGCVTANTLEETLTESVLTHTAYQRAETIQEWLLAEDGVDAACQRIEETLSI